MATSNYTSLGKAKRSTDPQQVTSRSYEGFLQWVSEEALAELCEAAAQEMGSTEPPTTHEQRRAIMRKAHNIYLERQWKKSAAAQRDRGARHRARKLNATIEHFTRHEIIDRDHSTCHICGKQCQPENIHLDHVIPLSKGGEHSRANVKVACAPCNIRKSDTMPSDVLVYDSPT